MVVCHQHDLQVTGAVVVLDFVNVVDVPLAGNGVAYEAFRHNNVLVHVAVVVSTVVCW